MIILDTQPVSHAPRPVPLICSRSRWPLKRSPLHPSISEPSAPWSVRSSKWRMSFAAMVRRTGRSTQIRSRAGSGA